MNTLKIKKISPNAIMPIRATEGAAGYDLCSTENVKIFPNTTALIATGLQMQIPAGYEVQVRPRSGLAAKHSITVLNSPGTIDCDYRGEVKVILHNLGKEAFHVEVGMRIAQMVIAKVADEIVIYESEKELDETLRGNGGFGSSGLK